MNEYFSDRENGPRARAEQTITPSIWKWIIDYTNRLMKNGAFGLEFPDYCEEFPQQITGSDDSSFNIAVKAEIPGLAWPPKDIETNTLSSDIKHEIPNTTLILDFIELIHKKVAKPISDSKSYHEFYRHHHLAFDKKEGQADFRKKINEIFQRNGLAYNLENTGKITRILDPILGPTIINTSFNSGDKYLDSLLETSRTKLSSRDLSVRREALESLWDAWERIKSMADHDKKKSTDIIIKTLAKEPEFYERLNKEAKELTEIGNKHFIRHTEVNQKPIIDQDQIDYLFYRMFAMILLILSKIDKWKIKQ